MKKLFALILVAMLAFACVACQPAATAPAAEEPAATQAPATEAPAVDTPAATGKVYYLNFKPEADAAWQTLAAQYTEKTGVPVTIVTAATGT